MLTMAPSRWFDEAWLLPVEKHRNTPPELGLLDAFSTKKLSNVSAVLTTMVQTLGQQYLPAILGLVLNDKRLQRSTKNWSTSHASKKRCSSATLSLLERKTNESTSSYCGTRKVVVYIRFLPSTFG
jgi:hypothetical protein